MRSVSCRRLTRKEKKSTYRKLHRIWLICGTSSSSSLIIGRLCLVRTIGLTSACGSADSTFFSSSSVFVIWSNKKLNYRSICSKKIIPTYRKQRQKGSLESSRCSCLCLQKTRLGRRTKGLVTRKKWRSLQGTCLSRRMMVRRGRRGCRIWRRWGKNLIRNLRRCRPKSSRTSNNWNENLAKSGLWTMQWPMTTWTMKWMCIRLERNSRNKLKMTEWRCGAKRCSRSSRKSHSLSPRSLNQRTRRCSKLHDLPSRPKKSSPPNNPAWASLDKCFNKSSSCM